MPPPYPAPAASHTVPLSLRPFPVEMQDVPGAGALGDTGEIRTMTTPNLGTTSRPRSPDLAQFLNPNSGRLGPGPSLLVGAAMCSGGFSGLRPQDAGSISQWGQSKMSPDVAQWPHAEPREPQDDNHNPWPGGGAGRLPDVRRGRAGRMRTKRQHMGGTVRMEGGARQDRTGPELDVDGRGRHSQMPRVACQS